MCALVNQIPINDPKFLLLPKNTEETLLQGFIIAKEEEFMLEIHLESSSTLHNANFKCEWKLKQLLSGYEDVLLKRLQQSSNLQSFLVELKSIIETLLSFRNAGDPPLLSISDNCNVVLRELRSIGWENVVHIDESFQSIRLSTRDLKGRQHVIAINLGEKGSAKQWSCVADLPEPFPSRNGTEGVLKLLYERFIQVVSLHQHFWDIVDEIDKSCWILEPEQVTRGCIYRRIALGKNASIYLKLNARHPFQFPECRFLGADHIIEPLRRRLANKEKSWDTTRSVLENLKILLDVEFPSPSTTSKEDLSMDCGICYSYRLLDELPDQICDDPRCGQTYHASCLVEWLRSVPSCRQSFNVIFGECPYCNKNLTVRLGKHMN